jgi:peptidoglycan/xylan/chitin deacetylase (PgdA/CDA1 family)
MTRAVLTFHSVDDTGSILAFPIAAFRRLVEHLAATKVAVVDFAELLRRRDGVTLTFDDGMRTVHRNALPVLRDHGFPAHLFLTTGRVGKDISWPSATGARETFDMLDWNEVEQCAAGGFRVESHTLTHPDLRELPRERIVEECAGADDEIERHTGRRPALFAFPFGRFDDRIRQVVAPRYTACFTTRLGYLGDTPDMSSVPRLDTYYLQAPAWYEHLFAARTRGYVALRGLIRAVRGVT